jgi:ABC-type transport system involved in cytochrome bd biosynthesis fused ATPase/permease subunit
MLLADARFLILDEPAAHLDPEGARLLMEDVLASLPPHVGVLVITHRPEGLESVDRVAVLDGGRIATEGAPSEVLLPS